MAIIDGVRSCSARRTLFPLKPFDPPTSASASAISQAANAKQPCLWTCAGTIYG